MISFPWPEQKVFHAVHVLYPCVDALHHVGMALAPWNVLAAGKFRTDAEEEARRKSGEKGRNGWAPTWERNGTERNISTALEKIAKEVGTEHISAGAHDNLLDNARLLTRCANGQWLSRT